MQEKNEQRKTWIGIRKKQLFPNLNSPQKYKSDRSASTAKTARLRTARRRLMCGPRRERAHWAESCCLIRWVAQRDEPSAWPDCCSSTWACSCSSVRWDLRLNVHVCPQSSAGFQNVDFFHCPQECFDSKPRIISKRSKENLAVCSNLTARHPFDDNKWAKCTFWLILK